MTCELCHDSGLEPIWEHISFPANSPGQRHVEIEPYEFDDERQWETSGHVHQRLEAYRMCSCSAGQQRRAAAKESQQARGRNTRGWQPKAGMEAAV